MQLFVVVHHRHDSSQPWANDWADDDVDLLRGITTTSEIGRLCGKAQRAGERVFVHRCAWSGSPATICCSVEVAKVDKLPGGAYVTFADAKVLLLDPVATITEGTNRYMAPPPKSK